VRRPPLWIAGILVTGIMAAGASLGNAVGSDPDAASTETLTATDVVDHTTTRKVLRVKRGRVVTLPGGTTIVRVPAFIVRTDHKVVRVPAQTYPLRAASSSGGGLTAAVDVPVTVTIYIPTVVTVPQTITETTTTTETILSTITLPLDVGAPTTG
jgi:hypothetical protein